MRPLLPLVLLALLAPPLAAAHVAFERPSLQRTEPLRTLQVDLVGPSAATFSLQQSAEPLRHAVRHDLDARGSFRVEHRADLSRPPDFFLETRLDRVLEYKDLNTDGRYTPDVDTPVRSWRFNVQPWRSSVVQNVTLAQVAGKSVTWQANGTPHFDLVAAATGRQVEDEGALARPQDVLLYLDLSGFPPRGVGNLHALEGSFRAPAGATLQDVLGPANETVGVYAEKDGRRGFFLWGGQATLDGKEQAIAFTRSTGATERDNATWSFRLHFPTTDRTAHLVLVNAIEYEEVERRSGNETLLVLVPGAVLAALALRRRA